MRYTQMFATVAAVMAALVSLAGAFSVLSESPSIKTRLGVDPGGNYTIIEGNTLYTVRCDSSDFGRVQSLDIDFPDGGTGRFNISCGTPVNRFKLTQIGWVPAEAVLGTVEQCSVIGSQGVTGKRVHHKSSDDGFHVTSRGLSVSMTRRPHHWYKDADDDTLRKSSLKRSMRPMWSPLGIVLNPIGSAAAAIAGAMGMGGSGDCPRCDKLQRGLDRANNRVRRYQRETQEAMTNFMGSLNDVQAGQADLSRQLGEGLSNNLEATNGLILASLEQANMTGRLAEQDLKQSKQLDRVFSTINQNQANTDMAIGNLTAQIAAATGATELAIRRAVNYTNEGLFLMRTTLDTFTNVTNDRLNNYDRMFGELSNSLTTVYATIKEVQQHNQDRADFSRAIHSLMGTLEDQGYEVFVKSRGVAPFDDTSDFPYLSVSQVSMAWVTSSTAFKVRFNYNCGTRFLLDRAELQHDPASIARGLGPDDCDPNDADTCTCWISVSASRCPKHLSYSFGSPPAFDSFANASALSTTFCSGSIVTSSSDIMSIGTLDTFWLNGSYAPCAAAPMAGTAYAVTELLMAKRALTYNDPGLCVASVFSLDRAVAPPIGAPVNPYLALFNMFRMQRALANSKLDLLEKRYHGLVPSGITFEAEPFTRRPHPDDPEVMVNAACIKAHFAAYRDLLPLYRMTAFASETAVTSTVERFLPGGGRTVSAATVRSVVLSAPLDNLLPVSGKLVVGDPAATDVIYDVPDADVSAGGVATSNAGAIGYVVSTNASLLMSQNAWVDNFGDVFHAPSAVTAPEQYMIAINGSTHTCILPRTANSGTLCEFRDNYLLTSTTINGTKYVLASQRGGFYQATINKPDGDLSMMFQSTCPTLTYGEATPAGVTVVLSVTSQLAAAVDARLYVEAANELCLSYQTDALVTPGSSASVLIPACEFGGNVSVTVGRLTATGYEMCPGAPLDVTAPTPEYLVTAGIATTGHTVSVASVNIDQAQVATQAAMLEIARFQGDTLVLLVDVFATMNIPVPEEAIALLEQSLFGIRDSIDAGVISTILSRRQPITTNFTEASNATYTQYDDQRDRALAYLVNATERVNRGRDIVTNFTFNYERQRALNAELYNYTVTVLEAQRRLFEAEDSLNNITGLNFRALRNALRSRDAFDLGDVFGAALGGVEGAVGLAEDIVKGGINVVEDAANLAVDGVKGVANEARDLARAAGGLLNNATGGIFGMFGNLVDIFLVIGAIVLAKFLYDKYQAGKDPHEFDRKVQEALIRMGMTVLKPVPPPPVAVAATAAAAASTATSPATEVTTSGPYSDSYGGWTYPAARVGRQYTRV